MGPEAPRLWNRADEACLGLKPGFPLECRLTLGVSLYLSEPDFSQLQKRITVPT